MMRSMYSAVSGLRIHQSKMDVIGNNIANVNTVGFKKGQVTFQEVFSQVVRGASAPTGGKGGTNPQQVGMGAAMGSINTIHTKGPGQRTDNPTDLMIDGEGFFVVSDDPNFNNRYFTRAGNFSLDRDGNLVTADGLKVLGYAADEDGNILTEVTNIRINMSETKAPTATDSIIFRGNLDSRVNVGDSQKIDTVIYDSLGNSYTLTFNVEKTGMHTWELSLSRITDRSTGYYTEETDGILTEDTLELRFDDNGKLIGIGNVNLEDTDEFTVSLANLSDITFTKGKDGEDLPEPVSPSGSFREIILFDSENEDTIKGITQYANEMGFKPYAMNGNTSGTLEGFAIDATGTVVGVFTNGERKALGRIM
ncbi:MAG: flagellar hook-basal body complex protein, partial [Tissierellia bacterium]|nr:flagellar hook-basal body complex protein [Tissierellia bacterium]